MRVEQQKVEAKRLLDR